MSSTRDKVEALIRQHHGELVRRNKHFVYRFPDGRCFTLSATPSGDKRRAEENNMSLLRRFLGIERETNKNPDRRVKPGVNGRQGWQGTACDVKMHNWKRDLAIQSRKLVLRD